jgi:hypothetical protein
LANADGTAGHDDADSNKRGFTKAETDEIADRCLHTATIAVKALCDRLKGQGQAHDEADIQSAANQCIARHIANLQKNDGRYDELRASVRRCDNGDIPHLDARLLDAHIRWCKRRERERESFDERKHGHLQATPQCSPEEFLDASNCPLTGKDRDLLLKVLYRRRGEKVITALRREEKTKEGKRAAVERWNEILPTLRAWAQSMGIDLPDCEEG